MNKLRYTFIFLILISLFPCYGILANEETNNVPSQEITESIEKKNITENVTETISTSTTENESEENHVNIKPQKKENILMKWLGFIILIAVIGFIIMGISANIFDNDLMLLLLPIIYFISAIVLKVRFGIGFFWSAIISSFFPLSINLLVYLIIEIIPAVWKAWRKWLSERERIDWEITQERRKAEERKCKAKEKERKIEKFSRILLNANLAKIRYKTELRMFIDDYDDIEFCQKNYEKIRDRIIKIRRQEAEIRKQKALEQIQNEAAEQIRANEDAMKKNEVERNMDELSGYIDMLGGSIQKKELPDVQVVSVLYKILISILSSKSYITDEGLCKICDDNDAFIKHVLEKCSELENFSGTLLETRMLQVKAKFDEILK